MHRIATLTAWICAYVLLAAASTTAQALSIKMMRDSDLLDSSQGAALVHVERELIAHDGDRATRYLIRVREVLTGPTLPPLEILGLPGTRSAPHLNFQVAGIPQLYSGQDLLLMYRRTRDGSLAATELTLGLFFEVDSPMLGRIYVRTIDNLPMSKSDMNREYSAMRRADAFEDWIRTHETKRDASSYLLPAEEMSRQEKFMLSQFAFGGNNPPPPGPGRWFEFDSDQTLLWTAGTVGQANTPNVDEFQQLRDALAAWTDDPGSKILLGFNNPNSGTVSNVIDNSGFTGKVTWDRNLDDADCGGPGSPTGQYNCNTGGVLALGGSFVFSNASMSNGTSYFPRTQGLVCVRANAGCAMESNGGLDGAELLTHEVGHALAFAHSCNEGSAPACNADATANDATMRPFIHGGRGAALAADDRAGAAFVYPAPVAPDMGPTVSANTPTNGSTTHLSGGNIGANTSTIISFTVSDGTGSGTTNLSCTASGTMSIVSGSPQSIPVGGMAANVVARFTLTASSQSGSVNCTATPQNGTIANLSYNFTAPAGTCSGVGDCVFENGFE